MAFYEPVKVYNVFLYPNQVKTSDSSPQTITGQTGGVIVSVEERVKKIIAEQLDVDADEIVPEASFVDDLGADSLDLVELVMAMEEAFDIEISDEEAEKLRTVQDAIDYINAHS